MRNLILLSIIAAALSACGEYQGAKTNCWAGGGANTVNTFVAQPQAGISTRKAPCNFIPVAN